MYIGQILAKSQCYYKSLKYVGYTELPVMMSRRNLEAKPL